MNKTLTMLMAAGALVIGAQQAQALTWSDAQRPNEYLSIGETAIGQFNIVSNDGAGYIITNPYPGITSIGDADGFTVGTDTATSAVAYFWFRDDENSDVAESVSIRLDGMDFASGEVKDAGVTVFGGAASILATINASGLVEFQVTATLGDFYLDYAYLEVEGTRDTGVPDGGATAALLGLGMLGVAATRRKIS